MSGDAVSKQGDRDAVAQLAGRAYEELRAWGEAHPRYTSLELEQQAMLVRQRLVGEMLSRLVAERQAVRPAEGVRCPACGAPMDDKGRRRRTVRGPEGAVDLERAYDYCPSCREGFFPPRPRAATHPAPVDGER